MSDETRGPEWVEMEERHTREGVSYWHADRAPGVTDEQIAGQINRVNRYLSCPYNNTASMLRGEASLLKDSAHCTLNSKDWNKDTQSFETVELTPIIRKKALAQQRLGELLIKAAELLEVHGDKTHARIIDNAEPN